MKGKKLQRKERGRRRARNNRDNPSIGGWHTNERSQSSMAVCPVRRHCPRFQAPGYTMRCRAGHDQGPHGYPVSEVEPMVPSVTVLTSIVTLSLWRPHFSCTDARPEAHAGIKDILPVHQPRFISLSERAERKKSRKRRQKGDKKQKRKGKEETWWTGRVSNSYLLSELILISFFRLSISLLMSFIRRVDKWIANNSSLDGTWRVELILLSSGEMSSR